MEADAGASGAAKAVIVVKNLAMQRSCDLFPGTFEASCSFLDGFNSDGVPRALPVRIELLDHEFLVPRSKVLL